MSDFPAAGAENPKSNPEGERIDVEDEGAVAAWARKLDTTPQQLTDAIAEVGDRAADVEMHLKGSHSTTNADRVQNAGGG